MQLCRDAGTPFLCVLNSVTSASLGNNARDTLTQFRVPLARQTIAQRVAYVNAMTSGKTGPEKDPKAADEIDVLWREIKKLALAAAKKKGSHND